MLTIRQIKAAAKKLKVRDLLPLKCVQEVDRGKEHIKPDSTYYPNRAAIAQLIQPRKKLGMFGLRFGYGALAMLSQCEPAAFRSWDDESDVPGSNAVAAAMLKERFPNVLLYPYLYSTSHLHNTAEQSMDLIYVDAGKSAEDVAYDLGIAEKMTHMAGSNILLDDTNMESVAKGLEQFMAAPFHDLAALEIPDDPKGLVLIGPKT